MSLVRTLLRLALPIVVILAALFGLVWLAGLTLSWIMGQDSQIAAAAIAFAGTVIAGIGAVVISQQRTKARELAEAHRPIKIELYTDFITQVVGLMRTGVGKSALDRNAQMELEEFFFDFTTKVMLLGSPMVLNAYSAFRGAVEDPKVILLVDDVLQAMRKDLGLSNWSLERGDLMKMLLSDPEKLDEVLRKHDRPLTNGSDSLHSASRHAKRV